MVSQHYFLTFGQNVEDLNMYKYFKFDGTKSNSFYVIGKIPVCDGTGGSCSDSDYCTRRNTMLAVFLQNCQYYQYIK